MRAKEIFSDALIIYLKKFWIYLLLSAFAILPLIASAFFMKQKKFSLLHFIPPFFSLIIASLLIIYMISFALKRRKSLKKALMLSILQVPIGSALWLSAYFAKGFSLILVGLISWMYGGLFVLFGCRMLSEEKQSFWSLVSKNKKALTGCFCYSFTVFVVMLLVALSAAHPSKAASIIPPPEQIIKNEKLSICLFLLFYLPLYVLTFVQMFEEISEKQR